VKITERFYSHWIKSRQELLEEEVKKAWASKIPMAQYGPVDSPVSE
jgi:hypothetical protein